MSLDATKKWCCGKKTQTFASSYLSLDVLGSSTRLFLGGWCSHSDISHYIIPSFIFRLEVTNWNPYWFSTLPHICIFGCLCFFVNPTKSDKLNHGTLKCIFVGYPSGLKCYKFYDLINRKVVVSRYAKFDDNFFPFAKHRSSATTSIIEVAPNLSFCDDFLPYTLGDHHFTSSVDPSSFLLHTPPYQLPLM